MSWLAGHTCDSKYHPRYLRPEGLDEDITCPGGEWEWEWSERLLPMLWKPPPCLEEQDFLTSEEGSARLVGGPAAPPQIPDEQKRLQKVLQSFLSFSETYRQKNPESEREVRVLFPAGPSWPCWPIVSEVILPWRPSREEKEKRGHCWVPQESAQREQPKPREGGELK